MLTCEYSWMILNDMKKEIAQRRIHIHIASFPVMEIRIRLLTAPRPFTLLSCSRVYYTSLFLSEMTRRGKERGEQKKHKQV